MKEFIGTFTVFFTVSFLHSSMASSSHLGSFASFFKHPTSRLIKSKVNRAIRPIYSSSNPLFIKRIRGGQRSDIDINTNLPKISIEKIDNTTIAKVDIPMNFAFSDVDGTLVHYPSENESTEGNDIIHLPPSSTGLKGVISAKTLKLCQILRHEQNVKLVLVSGMRTSTLLKRLPYLPKADAYAPEAGGRIFYPVTDLKDYSGTLVEPVHFNGASEEDVKAFGIVEDMDWREKLSQDQAAGGDGYIGDVMNTFLKVEQEEDNQVKPIKDRESSLWNFAKSLEAEGFVIDYKGYTCCFRVNRKQQDKEKISDDDFNKLSLRNVEKLGLASSVNLGCVDFYPIKSGKKNCCAYLATKFMSSQDNNAHVEINSDDLLLQRAFCFCDDDNDLEMASACGKVFLPSISSVSMAKAAQKNPEKIIITEIKEKNIVETTATESALLEALALLRERSQLHP